MSNLQLFINGSKGFETPLFHEIRDLLADGSPYAAALGMKITRLEPGHAAAEVPYQDMLIGDP